MHAGPDGKKWVGSSFNALSTKMIEYEEQDPFGEKYKQSWPATPYSVRVTNNSDSSVCADLYVDGKIACTEVLHPRGFGKGIFTVEFKGYQANCGRVAYVDDTISEFLFTLPRAEVRRGGAAPPPPRNPDLGTIAVKFWLAQKDEQRGTYVENLGRFGNRRGEVIKPLTKASMKDAKATTATATGANVQTMNVGKVRTYTSYVNVGQFPVTTVVRNYATRSQLEMKGIINPVVAALPGVKDELGGGQAKRRRKEEFTVDRDGAICLD